MLPVTVAAQEVPRFDVGANLTMATIRELDASDVGVSGRLGWRPTTLLGLEGEVALYPGAAPEQRPTSASRTEAAFGVTVGPQLGRARPFVRLRPGVLRLAAAPAPVACILIFPPPLACTLAGGRSLFMLDVGGGVEIDVSPRTFVRIDVGDRVVRYPGPAISIERVVRDDSFVGHDVRVGVGASWRF